MRRSDFNYELPENLIARHPAKERSGSRMMTLDGVTGKVGHKQFVDLPDMLQPGDLLVLNNTRVIPARLFGRKESGGKIEVLVERVLDEYRVLTHIRASKSPKVGAHLLLSVDAEQMSDAVQVTMLERRGDLFELEFPQDQPVLPVLDRIGHMPLPPYIDRPDETTDRLRYQTVFGQKLGAVAAPTAGLHFDDQMLELLREQGVEVGFVTLHVGAGTFQPVRADDIRDHVMHSEYLEVDDNLCAQVERARQKGGRVIAVGTTAVRCLETASRSDSGKISPYRGDTDIFIYPGYRFRCVDALLTNFHLPESTLIMLVSAFAGQENVLAAYREAVAEQYRFFSYGDCMFVAPNKPLSVE